MKLLILNRRCMRHPEKGGAEIYTMEIARSVAQAGGEVEWFCSKSKGLPDKEVVDGIRFIRKGNEFTVHFYGFFYALKKRKWIIIDEFNGAGFFTFFFKNSILLIHQLYDAYWNAEFGIFGYPFKFIERFFLMLYRKKPAITVSSSTANDLKDLGFNKIKIVYNGVDIKPLNKVPDKEEKLKLVYMGRLKKTKNPEDAIKAFLEVKKVIKNARLLIIGDGPIFPTLKNKYKHVKDLSFLGYVGDADKYKILKDSYLLLVPSIREGWGQVVLQANAVGVPTVGYNVPGLRDSIRDGKTGYLVKDYKEMAEKIIELWKYKETYRELSTNALKWAENYSWNKTKTDFLSYLKTILLNKKIDESN